MTTTVGSTSATLRNYWWVFLLQGLAALGFGLLLLFRPAATLIVLTTFLGAYWLIEGIFKVIGAFTGQNGDRSWWMLLLSGVLGIVGGLIVLGQPFLSTLITQLFAVYLLAGQALIGGILSIIWAIRVRDEIEGEGWIIVGGVLAILLAFMLIAAPFASLLTLVWLVALFTIVGGLGLIIAAFRWRSLPI